MSIPDVVAMFVADVKRTMPRIARSFELRATVKKEKKLSSDENTLIKLYWGCFQLESYVQNPS